MTADGATPRGARVLVTGASRGAHLPVSATAPAHLARVITACQAHGAQVTGPLVQAGERGPS